jgi:hypothetical protein
MKAKFYSGLLSALILACLPAKAQYADNTDYNNDGTGTVINNYYMDDYDYYYSSRINRFHRSYAAFDYYSPVFTDSYWYNYKPFSWGVSIYGRSGFGFGFSFNYPVYYYDYGYNNWYGYNYGMYDPYYGSSWCWGYDPFYYSWYSPFVININIGHRWRDNYWGGYGHNNWYNDYRPEYYSHNDYYNNYHGTRNSFREFPGRDKSRDFNRPNPDNGIRREAPGSRPDMNKNNGGAKPGAGSNNRNNGNNSNNGNNQNSRTYGNNGNFGHNGSNTGNNGNNNNSRPGGNNGNFRNNPGERKGSAVPSTNPSNRRMEQTAPARSNYGSTKTRSQGPATAPSRSQVNSGSSSGRTYNAPARTSSSQRSGATMSRSRGSSSGSAARSSSSGSRSKPASTSRSSSGSKSRSGDRSR